MCDFLRPPFGLCPRLVQAAPSGAHPAHRGERWAPIDPATHIRATRVPPLVPAQGSNP